MWLVATATVSDNFLPFGMSAELMSQGTSSLGVRPVVYSVATNGHGDAAAA